MRRPGRLRLRVAMSPGCRAGRDRVLRARVRALAPVMAATTAGWIALDVFVLSRAELLAIAPLRLLLAAALVVLSRAPRYLSATTLVHAFVWMQAVGFAAVQLLVRNGDAAGIGYGLFPFIVAAQLALFPFTWLQTLRSATAPAAMLAVALAADPYRMDARAWNDIWLLVLLVFVAAWTAHAQLELLVRLFRARVEAAHDPLTGLANRRQLDDRLEAERARALRHGAALSLLMCDLDHFKRVNDHHGHAAGDAVLAAAAGAVAAELRASDLAARYGGEEFVVVLPDTALAQALALAERIRMRVGALRIDTGAADVAVTVSIGVAQLEGDESRETLVERADGAMYEAKRAGRDRIAGAPRATRPPP